MAVLTLAMGPTMWQAATQEVTEPQVTAAQADVSAHFEIRAFQVRGNSVLPPQVVERAVYPHMGPDKTSEDVEQARAALQQAFEDAGYVAVAVFIPEQSVEGGLLQLEEHGRAHV